MSQEKRELKKMERKWEKSLGHSIDPVTDYWTEQRHCDRGYKVVEKRVVPEVREGEKKLVKYRHCVMAEFAEEVLKGGEVVVRKPELIMDKPGGRSSYGPKYEKTPPP